MIQFKSLETSQIKTIVQMMQDFYAIDDYPIDVEISKNLFQEFISDEKMGKSWLIYFEDKIVGYVIVTYIFSFEYKGRIAFLDELYIKETFRGKGIGKQAIVFVKEEASSQNIKLIYLEVENHNQNAQKMYLANDFVVHHRKLLKHKLF